MRTDLWSLFTTAQLGQPTQKIEQAPRFPPLLTSPIPRPLLLSWHRAVFKLGSIVAGMLDLCEFWLDIQPVFQVHPEIQTDGMLTPDPVYFSQFCVLISTTCSLTSCSAAVW